MSPSRKPSRVSTFRNMGQCTKHIVHGGQWPIISHTPYLVTGRTSKFGSQLSCCRSTLQTHCSGALLWLLHVTVIALFSSLQDVQHIMGYMQDSYVGRYSLGACTEVCLYCDVAFHKHFYAYVLIHIVVGPYSSIKHIWSSKPSRSYPIISPLSQLTIFNQRPYQRPSRQCCWPFLVLH